MQLSPKCSQRDVAVQLGKWIERKKKVVVTYLKKSYGFKTVFQDWENETKKMRENLKNTEGAREEDQVKLAEFDVGFCHVKFFLC